MDKIKNSVNSLMTADSTLKGLSNNICTVVSKSEAAIKDQFDGIDTNFQNSLLEYLDDLLSFKNNIVEFEVANRKAIQDRINRISEYSATAYKQRNIL